MRDLGSAMGVVVLVLQPLLAAAAPAEVSSDAEIQRGMKQVDEGDYDAAIFTLDAAATRLASDPRKSADLSQAYLYLGIAYLGKGHEAAAHAKFRAAVEQIRDISLSPDRFPPKVIDALESARAEVREAAAATKPAESPAAASTVAPEKKGGSKTLLVVGGVALAGGGAALALGGGGDGGSGPAAPADNRRTETFTGTLCGNYEVCPTSASRGYDIVITTAGTLDATVTWGNSSIFFTLELVDEHYERVAVSNRITNTMSQLSASVTPRTSGPNAAYLLFVNRGDGSSVTDDYSLTVRHP